MIDGNFIMREIAVLTYEVHRLQLILETVVNKPQVPLITKDEIEVASEKAVRFVQGKFPDFGIKSNL